MYFANNVGPGQLYLEELKEKESEELESPLPRERRIRKVRKSSPDLGKPK